ncbi:MAG TPA: hypothetical protein VGO80_03690, partial [Solirubrobacteraceae bacterium]|nr:hypothetical protein [Solirubrobacteraceae bacterium]
MSVLEHRTADAVQQPSAARDEHQTVIKFVISGPIFGVDDAEVAQVAPPPTAVAELGRRVTALERALADADARIDALSRAPAAAVADVAPAPGNWTSRRTERGVKAPAAEAPASAPPPQPVPARAAFEAAP